MPLRSAAAGVQVTVALTLCCPALSQSSASLGFSLLVPLLFPPFLLPSPLSCRSARFWSQSNCTKCMLWNPIIYMKFDENRKQQNLKPHPQRMSERQRGRRSSRTRPPTRLYRQPDGTHRANMWSDCNLEYYYNTHALRVTMSIIQMALNAPKTNTYKILKETIIWERWDEGHEVWWDLSQAKNWKTTNPHWMKRPTLC